MPIRVSQPPQRLLDGRFQLLSEAGSGGMGTVYKAIDAQTGAMAAVKILRTETRDGSKQRERFRREASVLAELQHRGIVSYLGSGESSDGQPYLAMEWLEGQDLAKRLTHGPLGIDESIRLLRQLATALASAHSRGIVHRG